jgi:hypothetical protein
LGGQKKPEQNETELVSSARVLGGEKLRLLPTARSSEDQSPGRQDARTPTADFTAENAKNAESDIGWAEEAGAE